MSLRAVLRVLKKKFRFSFRRVKRVAHVGNSEKNRVLRHLYARKMLKIYSDGAHVINIDESWVPVTDFRSHCWNRSSENNSLPEQVMGHKVNLICAVSSEGLVWLSQTQCNTDENVMQMFLSKLAQVWTQQYGKGWRDRFVVLLDGASYHRSIDTRKCIAYLGMRVVLSAPYSYQTAPAELWFAHFKQGDFNEVKIKTGKR